MCREAGRAGALDHEIVARLREAGQDVMEIDGQGHVGVGHGRVRRGRVAGGGDGPVSMGDGGFAMVGGVAKGRSWVARVMVDHARLGGSDEAGRWPGRRRRRSRRGARRSKRPDR